MRIFTDHVIYATWTTVGFLFFENLDDLKGDLPAILPKYKKEDLSPYKYIAESVNLKSEYHVAKDLISTIQKCKGQEIGTHTFSYYYCLEEGQTISEFEADITSAIQIAKSNEIYLNGIVFPRNQFNLEYLYILNKLGIMSRKRIKLDI